MPSIACRFHVLAYVGCSWRLAAISCTVLSPRSASSATVALKLSEKFRRFVIHVSIHSGWTHLSTLSEFAGPLQILVGSEGYILKSINRHGQIGSNLNPASISTILKALQAGLQDDTKGKSLSGHLFRVGAALDLLEQGELLEKTMLKGGCQTDSTAMKYLRNWRM